MRTELVPSGTFDTVVGGHYRNWCCIICLCVTITVFSTWIWGRNLTEIGAVYSIVNTNTCTLSLVKIY